jgi:hypothetical protein
LINNLHHTNALQTFQAQMDDRISLGLFEDDEFLGVQLVGRTSLSVSDFLSRTNGEPLLLYSKQRRLVHEAVLFISVLRVMAEADWVVPAIPFALAPTEALEDISVTIIHAINTPLPAHRSPGHWVILDDGDKTVETSASFDCRWLEVLTLRRVQPDAELHFSLMEDDGAIGGAYITLKKLQDHNAADPLLLTDDQGRRTPVQLFVSFLTDARLTVPLELNLPGRDLLTRTRSEALIPGLEYVGQESAVAPRRIKGPYKKAQAGGVLTLQTESQFDTRAALLTKSQVFKRRHAKAHDLLFNPYPPGYGEQVAHSADYSVNQRASPSVGARPRYADTAVHWKSEDTFWPGVAFHGRPRRSKSSRLSKKGKQPNIAEASAARKLDGHHDALTLFTQTNRHYERSEEMRQEQAKRGLTASSSSPADFFPPRFLMDADEGVQTRRKGVKGSKVQADSSTRHRTWRPSVSSKDQKFSPLISQPPNKP